jgi:hypothetical protein
LSILGQAPGPNHLRRRRLFARRAPSHHSNCERSELSSNLFSSSHLLNFSTSRHLLHRPTVFCLLTFHPFTSTQHPIPSIPQLPTPPSPHSTIPPSKNFFLNFFSCFLHFFVLEYPLNVRDSFQIIQNKRHPKSKDHCTSWSLKSKQRTSVSQIHS